MNLQPQVKQELEWHFFTKKKNIIADLLQAGANNKVYINLFTNSFQPRF